MSESGEIDLPDIFDGDASLFESVGRQNGFTTWSAREFAEYLGYKDYKAFKSAMNRAQQTLLSLDIPVTEHFKQEKIIDEPGKEIMDTRLSRFACYLVAMNGDPKKKQVARAQAYFAKFNEECQRFLDDAEQIERVLIRDEVSEHEKTLSATAQSAGVKDYALFRNAGYRGLYNMNLADLRKLKNIPDKHSALDFMGKDELAANLFRITQTDAKIRRDQIKGQKALEITAEDVGRTVRETMHQISGQRPEDLPAQEDIKKVRIGLRDSSQIIKETSLSDLLPPTPTPQPGEYLEAPEEHD